MDLRTAGFRVDSVEIDPKVVETARKHFGFVGPVYTEDALAHLRKTWRVYDVIVLDAFVGEKVPAHLTGIKAFELVKQHLYAGGLAAMRFIASPKDENFRKLLSRAEKALGSAELYGGGVGDEKQVIYALFGGEMISPRGIPVWPINPHIYECKDSIRQFHTNKKLLGVKGERRGVLVGYLVLYGEKKTLCLDLPHDGMGATRLVLRGDVRGIGELLTPDMEFPCAGGIPGDGHLGPRSTAEPRPSGAHMLTRGFRGKPYPMQRFPKSRRSISSFQTKVRCR